MSFIGTDNEFEIPDVSTERENLIDSNLNQGITIKLAPKQVDVTGIPNDQSNFVEEFGGSFIIKKQARSIWGADSTGSGLYVSDICLFKMSCTKDKHTGQIINIEITKAEKMQKRRDKKKNFFLLILSLIFISPSFGQEKNIYKQALANLYNYSTIGYRDFSDVFTQGDLVYTNSENDFAISGEGFFKLTDLKTGNILFTRNGQFIKQKNELYSVNGLKVITDNGIPVIFSAKEFDYTTDDNIYFLIKSDSFRIESKAIKGCLELSNVYPLDSLNSLIRYISEVGMSLPAFDRILSELNGLRDSYKEFVQTRKIETLTDYIMRLEMDKIIFYSILDKI